MNILPLVYGFIILFAIGTYTFLHTLRAALQEKFHYTGAIAIERTYANKIQSKNYKSQKGENLTNLNSSRSESKKKKDIEFLSPRDKFNHSIYRKLNIKELLKPQGNSSLEKLTLHLIKDLYQYTSIYVNGMEHEVLDTILSTLKVHPTITSFEALLPKLPEASLPLFYKLIKGTQTYELKKNSGYPALGDFLSLDPKSQKKPIDFSCASRTLLNALFGEGLTEQIIALERRKWEVDHKHKALTKVELEAFLIKCKKNPLDFEQMLEFTDPKRKRSQEVIKDDNTNLQIRINT